MNLSVAMVPPGERSTVADVWSRLEQGTPSAPVSVSWAWTEAWLRHFGDVVPHRFLLVRRGEDVVGATLLTRSSAGPRALRVRRLHLGTAGEPAGTDVFVEHNSVLCAPGDQDEVCRAIGDQILRVPAWDEVRFDGFDPDVAAALGRVLPWQAVESPSWTIRLDPATPVLDSLGRSTRRLIRQAVTSLTPDDPEVATTPEHALEILDELVELHQQRWRSVGEPGAFESGRRHGFVRDALLALRPAGRAMALRLSGGSRTIGCVVGWVEHGRFLYYQGGFQQFDDPKKRAGLLAHVQFAEYCRTIGMTEYELLAGDAQYKTQLSAGEHNSLVWARHRRTGLRTGMIDVARRLRSEAERRRSDAGPAVKE